MRACLLKSVFVVLAVPALAGAAGPAPVDPPPGGPPDERMVLTDAQIVGILHAVNQGEIATAEQALQLATSPEVADYAARLVADHTALDQRLLALAQELGIAPEPSPFSQKLAAGTDHVLTELAELSGNEYDVAFTDSQLVLHAGAVFLTDLLSKKAGNGQLLDAIDVVRPILLEHLAAGTGIREGLPDPTARP